MKRSSSVRKEDYSDTKLVCKTKIDGKLAENCMQMSSAIRVSAKLSVKALDDPI